MKPVSNIAELDDLIDDLVFGRLSVDKIARLDQILASDDEAYRCYQRFVGLHVMLESLSTPVPAVHPPSFESERWTVGEIEGPTVSHDDSMETREHSRISGSKGRQPTTVIGHLAAGWGSLGGISRAIAFAISGLLIVYFALLVFAVVWDQAKWADRVHERPHSFDGNHTTVAIVSDTLGITWSDKVVLRAKNAAVKQGELLKIESGTIELELNAGTKVVVEGPADWSVDGSNRVSLRAGKLEARVPKTAIGFTVETPAATIVDLGTEFGVEVTDQDSAQVTVFKGKVRIEPSHVIDASGKQFRPTTLSAGESRRITRDTVHGASTVEQSSSSNFIRKFKQESLVNGSMLPPHLVRIEDSRPQRMTRLEDSHFQAAQDDLLQTALDPKMPVRPAADTPGLFPGERLDCLFNGRLYVPKRTDLFVYPAAASIHEDSFTPVDRSSVEFYFDTSKAPQGYDIHRIESISSWLGARAGQYYVVFVRLRGSSNFERRRLVDVNAPPVATYDYYERRIKISSKGGAPLAKNVDAIRFVFINFETGSDPESKYREIDVIGSPTRSESSH